MLGMSRCVVGSSIRIRLGGSSSSFTSANRLFSPPLRTFTFLNTSSRLRKGETDLLLVGGWRLDFFHALDLLEFRLRLRCLGVLGAETHHELHQPPDFALLIFVGGEQLYFVRLTLRQVVIVVAAV